VDCWPLVNTSFPDNWGHVCVSIRPSGCDWRTSTPSWAVHAAVGRRVSEKCVWRVHPDADHVPKEFRRGKWMRCFPPHRLSGQVGNAIAPVHAQLLAQANLENFRSGTRGKTRGQGQHPRHSCRRRKDSYLVDPASSHMLVSKIKPCMSKYKQSIQ
jgi:hypothetical protein